MKISGIGFVYMITCIITGKIYVGSCLDIEKRWYRYKHLYCVRQFKLHNSFIKYGINNHVFEIIWAGDVLDMLKYESLIGMGFNVLDENGLNCMLPKFNDIYIYTSKETREKISIGNIGKKHTQITKDKIGALNKGNKSRLGKILSIESKLKISSSHKGKKASEDTKLKMSLIRFGKKLSNNKPIIQLDLNDNFIKEWEGAKFASEILGINRSSITQCCKGKNYKQVGGFKWKYKL